MFYGEYDYETDIKVQREEAMEEGRARGMEEGRARGMEEGRARGMEEGLTRGKEEVVRNMLALGMSLGEITSCTGLTADEVGALVVD